MNDVWPAPTPPAPGVTSDSPGASPERAASWVKAVVSVIALDVVAVFVGIVGFLIWFVLLWDGVVADVWWIPLLVVCVGPAFAIWIGSGWLAARLTGERNGWLLLLLAPLVAGAVSAALGLS